MCVRARACTLWARRCAWHGGKKATVAHGRAGPDLVRRGHQRQHRLEGGQHKPSLHEVRHRREVEPLQLEQREVVNLSSKQRPISDESKQTNKPFSCDCESHRHSSAAYTAGRRLGDGPPSLGSTKRR